MVTIGSYSENSELLKVLLNNIRFWLQQEKMFIPTVYADPQTTATFCLLGH